VKAALLRKFGPLPAIAWLGLFGAGAVVYRHFRPGTPPAAAAATDTGAGGGLDSGFGGGAGGGGSGALPPDQANPVPQADLGGAGTPVIFDPLTGDTSPYDSGFATDPGERTPQDAPPYPGYSPTSHKGAVERTPQPGQPPTSHKGTAASDAIARYLRNHPTNQPVRPARSTGRQQPRKTHDAPARRPAPARPRAVPKPVTVAHRAPPIAPPKKRKAVQRPTAQQAHNHGEPAPVRARTATAAAPARTTQSVQQAAPLPARTVERTQQTAPPTPGYSPTSHKGG
jgi:hypothetical protein